MFATFSTPQILAIIIGTTMLYVIILAFVYGKKYWAAPKTVPVILAGASSTSIMGAALESPRPPLSTPDPSFTTAGNVRSDEEEELAEEFFIPEGDVPFLEEQQTTLLKEAERVVEQIQLVVDHIVARPANPEEVFSKIQAIVSDYSFFFDTEYYDAINRFVAVTVHRDCDLELTEEDLQSLWYAAAA